MTEYRLNLGPQHPSTHGVLRLILDLEGEKILSCEPDVGYLHRGMEKMAEKLTYIQYLPLVDRIDYLAGFFYSELYCRTIEKACEIELSEKVKNIRVLLLEMNRIASHLLWIGTFLMDLGAVSPFFYTFRERELILKYFEKITGQRMMYNYFTFGGIRRDLFDLDDIENITQQVKEKLDDYEKLIEENPIFIKRTKNKGILTKELAFSDSIIGVNLRASGVDIDFRKNDYLYKNINFKSAVLQESDCLARYRARILEIKESINIINQVLELLKSSNPYENNNPSYINLKLPEGEYYSEIEAPRGLACLYIKSDGHNKPYRLKWRTPSYYSVNLLRNLLKGTFLNDAIAISGSLDIILPEVDK